MAASNYLLVMIDNNSYNNKYYGMFSTVSLKHKGIASVLQLAPMKTKAISDTSMFIIYIKGKPSSNTNIPNSHKTHTTQKSITYIRDYSHSCVAASQ